MKKNINLAYIIISAISIPLLVFILVSNKNDISALNKNIRQKDSTIKYLKNQLDNFENKYDQLETVLDTIPKDTIPKNEKIKPKSDKLNNNNQKTKIVEEDKNKDNTKIVSSKTHNKNENKLNSRTISYKNQAFNTFIVELSKSDLSFNTKTKSGKKIETISNLKKYFTELNKTLVFATNGGMFNPEYNPVGLYVENGEELSPVNLEEGDGNFFLKPNGIFYINKWNGAGIIESSKYHKIKGKIKYATQSGPLLLINGKVHDKLGKNSPNKHIRSGVGIIDKNTVVFIISKKPVNFYDLAMLFKNEFNCKNALYLDGFISEMYLPELDLTKSKNKFSILINVTKKSK